MVSLNDWFDGRFILGLGVSHIPMVEGLRGHRYDKPLATMRAYLEGIHADLPSGLEAPVVVAAPGTASLLAGLDGDPPDFLGPAVDELARRFDPEWGGFGGAPKFPRAGNLEARRRRRAATTHRMRRGARRPSRQPALQR